MANTKNAKTQPTGEAQEKLNHAVHSAPGDNRNQNHNAKKEALGPNTKR